jgi:hypothetical protein
MGLETGMDSMELGGDDMDMTAASDDDVIAIYKLSGEDEIEIVGDDIHLNINEPGEYVVKVQLWVVKVKRITQLKNYQWVMMKWVMNLEWIMKSKWVMMKN